MKMNQINMDEIRDFIYRKIKEEGGVVSEIDGDVELVESRTISSLLLIQIIAGIEDIVGTSIISDHIGLEDFSTINRILNTVHEVCNNHTINKE